MRVLLDQGTPAPLRHALVSHEVSTAYELGWSKLKNGELLAKAEAGGFEVFVTTDMNLRYQQNLAERKLAIVVLLSTSWPRIQRVLDDVRVVVDSASIGTYAEVAIPFPG